MEAREKRRKRFRIGSLAAHAGVDFKMNGEGANIRSARGGFKFIELPGIPDDGSEFVADDIVCLAREDAADYEDTCVGAKTARFDAFFDAGDTKPASSGANSGGSAELERVTVGIGLDDGEEFNLRASEVGKKTIVIFESAGADFDPAGARLHQTIQSTV